MPLRKKFNLIYLNLIAFKQNNVHKFSYVLEMFLKFE